MPTFDISAYEKRVLRTLSRRMPYLPRDLATRYAIESNMQADELRDRIGTVVRLWNKRALNQGPVGLVARRLINEHDRLLGSGAELTSPAFWSTWTGLHRRKVDQEVKEFAASLKAMYGPLGAITMDQLRAEAETYADFGDADLDRARITSGLELVEPIELPKVLTLRSSLRTFNRAMLGCGMLSIPQLLFPDLISFRLLDGFAVKPAPYKRTIALTHIAAAERLIELDAIADTQDVRAQRLALGLLITESRAGVDLNQLALLHLIQPIRKRKALGVQARTLHAMLLHNRLDAADAGRIINSILNESAFVSHSALPGSKPTSATATGKAEAASTANHSISIVNEKQDSHQQSNSARVSGDPRHGTFLCHSSGDKESVRTLHRRLSKAGVECWFDEEDIIPGQDFDFEIRKALRRCRYVIVCLTRHSTTRVGYVQKELRYAIDLAKEQPHGEIFLIGARLEQCSVPDDLRHLNYVDLYAWNGFERLLRSLRDK